MKTNKTKYKHNKRRNTAFLYEILLRQLTKYTLAENKRGQQIILSIIKEHFRSDLPLGKELEIYKAILDTKKVPKEFAEKLFYALKEQYKDTINSEEIFNEQSEVIEKINKSLPSQIFSNYVPNYKSLATINQIFGNKMATKERILLENQLIDEMVTDGNKSESKEQIESIDELSYRTFVKKFNVEYSTLLTEQVELLSKYVSCFHDNGLELRVYLNEELGRLKEEVEKSLKMKEIKEDQDMLEKTKQVMQIMEGFKKSPVNEEMLEQVMKIQELVKEIKENEY